MKNSKSFFEKDYLELSCSGSSEPQDVLSQILLIIFFFARYFFALLCCCFVKEQTSNFKIEGEKMVETEA